MVGGKDGRALLLSLGEWLVSSERPNLPSRAMGSRVHMVCVVGSCEIVLVQQALGG